jgi:hypothetical protein
VIEAFRDVCQVEGRILSAVQIPIHDSCRARVCCFAFFVMSCDHVRRFLLVSALIACLRTFLRKVRLADEHDGSDTLCFAGLEPRRACSESQRVEAEKAQSIRHGAKKVITHR